MTQAPPALSALPQFTPEYWRKAPRETFRATIQRVTHLEEGWVEIVMQEGMVLRRRRSDIQQLLGPNMKVNVETFNKELVTGLFVEGVGWAFRMTAEDLAEYAQESFSAEHRRQLAAREAMVQHVATALASYFIADGAKMDTVDGPPAADILHDVAPFDPVHLARSIIASLQEGPRA